MAIWEKFADFFGSYYTTFVALTGHCVFFLGCMSFSWTSPVLPKLMESEENPLGRPISSEESDLIGAIFYIGSSIGPLFCIPAVETFGRKTVLILLSVIAVLGYVALTFASTIEMYYICRTVIGFYVGAAFSIEPPYISQILSEREREFLMSCVSVIAFSGILSAVSIGPYLSVQYFNAFMALIAIFILLLVTMGFPESPYHVMSKEGKDETRKVLEKLRANEVEEELNAIEKSVATEIRESYFDIFRSVENLKYLISATIPLLLQVYSGIALLTNYSQLIFMETNISIPYHICSIIVAALTLFTSFLGPCLLKSNRVTLKNILIIVLCGVGFCDLILSLYFLFGRNYSQINWLPLATLICFVVIYNFGLDPIPWIILGNIYPVNISAVGTALSASCFQLSVFPILFVFHKIDLGYMFLFSSCVCYLGVIYVKSVIPHTKVKTSKGSVAC